MSTAWSLIRPLAGGVAALGIAAALLVIGFVVAHRLLRSDRARVRLAAALVTGWGLAVATFWVTSAVALFELWFILPLTVGIAAATLSVDRSAIERARRDLLAGRDALREIVGGSLVALSAVAVVVVTTMRFLRGLIAPPLGWDSLTYHLFKAGRWLRHGGWAAESAPDMMDAYEFFPVAGDILWAWAMLPTGSDVLVPVMATTVWLVAAVALYAGARELGAERETAALAALAVLALPSALAHLTSAYVDVQALALFALATVFVVRLAGGAARIREAPLAAAALSLMVGVKPTTAPVAVVGGTIIVVAWLRSTVSRRRKLAVAGIALVALALGSPSYVRSWVVAGSPVHPFGAIPSPDARVVEGLETEPLEVAASLLYEPTREGAFLNPGVGGALLFVVAGVGLVRGAWDPHRRVALSFLAVSMIAIPSLAVFPQSNFFLSSAQSTTFGRFFLPAFAAAALIAVRWIGVSARWPLTVAAVVGAMQAWPRGWRLDVEAMPLALAVALVAVVSTAVWLVVRSRWRGCPGGTRTVLVLLIAGLACTGLSEIRDRWRYALWGAAGDPENPLFHTHPLHPVYTNAWGLWQVLDDPSSPRTVAVTAGWDGLGHNWYRYPLLGRRLQNRVVYVPVSASGEVVDYHDEEEVAARADRDAWLRRLLAAEVDLVVSLAPRTTVEQDWIGELPDLFPPVVGDRAGFHRAYAVDEEAVRRRFAVEVPSPPWEV